ncbi:MAG TPA: hypothetical protein VOA00_05695 [Thermoanaerobaculia bacterium]|nr:hypothetical protein [Thermoanaerobaculia bacterium]HXM78710.1 hypothetical protein [Thermoanaerobaculia bacterium]
MHFTHLLRLVSNRDAAVLPGKSKDPNWPGWIPVQSFGVANRGVAIGSSGASKTPESPAFPGQEYYFVVNSDDVDIHALHRWFLNGEPVSAKLSAVPAAVGEEGFQFYFEGALISSLQMRVDATYFSLSPERVERRYLMRYR